MISFVLNTENMKAENCVYLCAYLFLKREMVVSAKVTCNFLLNFQAVCNFCVRNFYLCFSRAR